MPNVINAVEAMMHETRRLIINKLAEELMISHGWAHQIIHDGQDYNKNSATWVPIQAIFELKECHVTCARCCYGIMKMKEISSYSM